MFLSFNTSSFHKSFGGLCFLELCSMMSQLPAGGADNILTCHRDTLAKLCYSQKYSQIRISITTIININILFLPDCQDISHWNWKLKVVGVFAIPAAILVILVLCPNVFLLFLSSTIIKSDNLTVVGVLYLYNHSQGCNAIGSWFLQTFMCHQTRLSTLASVLKTSVQHNVVLHLLHCLVGRNVYSQRVKGTLENFIT